MNGEKGSVLMEYVVLTCFVSIFLLKFLHSDFYNLDQGYVGMGRDWAEHVQLLHRVIAAPIP